MEDALIEWCRAKITKMSRLSDRAVVKLIDFGNEFKLQASEIMVLPKKYTNQPPFAFEIKV